MIFALGFLVSGLLALLFLPAFWRRALRLSRRRLEMLTPLSLEEILAERDQLRAQAAVDMRRAEQRLERLTQDRAGFMSEISRRTAIIARLEEQLGTRSGDLRDRDAELKAAWAELGAMHADVFDLEGRLGQATADLAALRGVEGRLRADFDALRIDKAALETTLNHQKMQGEGLRQRLEAAQITLDERAAQMRKLTEERDLSRLDLATASLRIQDLEAREQQERRLRIEADAALVAARSLLAQAQPPEPPVSQAQVILYPVLTEIAHQATETETAPPQEGAADTRHAAVN